MNGGMKQSTRRAFTHFSCKFGLSNNQLVVAKFNLVTFTNSNQCIPHGLIVLYASSDWLLKLGIDCAIVLYTSEQNEMASRECSPLNCRK